MGEAPGNSEDRKGTPFTGPSGQLLRSTLRRVGLDDGDGYYFNAVCCNPHGTPNEEALVACRQNLIDQWEFITSTGVEYVLVCGTTALSSLAHRAVAHRWRGLCIPLHGLHIYPVYHPSYILRQKEEYKGWESQLNVFAGLVHGLVYPEATWPREPTCLYCSKRTRMGQPVCGSKSPNHMNSWVRDQKWHKPMIEPRML